MLCNFFFSLEIFHFCCSHKIGFYSNKRAVALWTIHTCCIAYMNGWQKKEDIRKLLGKKSKIVEKQNLLEFHSAHDLMRSTFAVDFDWFFCGCPLIFEFVICFLILGQQFGIMRWMHRWRMKSDLCFVVFRVSGPLWVPACVHVSVGQVNICVHILNVSSQTTGIATVTCTRQPKLNETKKNQRRFQNWNYILYEELSFYGVGVGVVVVEIDSMWSMAFFGFASLFETACPPGGDDDDDVDYRKTMCTLKSECFGHEQWRKLTCLVTHAKLF